MPLQWFFSSGHPGQFGTPAVDLNPSASWSLHIDSTLTPPYIEMIKLMTRESRLNQRNAKEIGEVMEYPGYMVAASSLVIRLSIVAIGLLIVNLITPTWL